MREFREWGHKLIDWVADYLDHPDRYNVVSALHPNDVVNALPPHGPAEGESMEAIFADFERVILPGITHWNHPNFFAYFANSAAPPAILADLLAAALNQNPMIWKTSPAATELEIVTLRWLLDWMDLPPNWFGMILDTASTATLHAIAAARVHACPELRDEGAPRNLIVYVSEQAHNSIEKGAMALGVGRNNVRRIPADSEFRMIPAKLEEAIRADRARSLAPSCIVATVGTTSTTSIDPVPAIADIARRENIWLHIDAAYAGSAAIVPEFRGLFEGCDRADSLVFNPHKWLMVPVDCSVLWCRDRAALRRAFSLSAEYLETAREGDNGSEGVNFMDYSIPLGRRFRALKLWFVLRYYGRDGLARIIREHVAMARVLRERIAANPAFELCAPTPFSTVCFRLRGSDERNRELLTALTEERRFFLSGTTIAGRFTLRIAIGNYKTEPNTITALWDDVENLSRGLSI